MITSGIAGRPTGTVRVNPRAPYADKLVGAYLFGHPGYAMDVAGRNSTGLGTAVQVPSPFGLGVQTLTGQGFVTPANPPFVASFAVGGHIPTANQTGLVIGAGDDVWNMASFNWGCFTSSGTWRFGLGLRGSVGASTPAPVGRFDVGMSRDPTAIVPTATCYVSGVPVLSDTYNGGTDASKQLRSTVSVQAPSQVILDYLLMFSATLPDWVHAEIRRNPYQYFQTAGRSLWYVPAAAGGLSISASSALSLGASAAVSTGTSMSIATSIAFGASATVVQGMSLAATSALSLGSAATVTIVGPPTTISTTSALSLGAASTVTFTSPALSISATSSLSLGSTAALTFVGPPTTISTTSALSLGSAATVTLTSQAIGFSASSALSLGASAAVTLTTATTIAAASSLSLGASAAVTLGGSVATTISATSALSLGASATVTLTSAYDTLLEAVVATLKAGLVTPGTVTGVWYRLAPPGTATPFVVVSVATASEDWASIDSNEERPTYDTWTIDVSTYHTGSKLASTIGRSIRDLLTDAALTFDEGTLLQIAQTSFLMPEQDPDRSPTGSPLWRDWRSFTAVVERLA